MLYFIFDMNGIFVFPSVVHSHSGTDVADFISLYLNRRVHSHILQHIAKTYIE